MQRQRTSPSLFARRHGLFHDLERESDDADVQLDHPEHVQRRARRRLSRQQPLGRLLQAQRPEAPTQLHRRPLRRRPVPRHVIPAIERSPAYRDGGLIDITFDEAFPPFTFTGNSFANSKRVPPTAATSIANDTAGETLFGRSVHFEPTGPNTPLAKNALGQELYPGPGDNAFVDRPANCVRPDRAAPAEGHVPARRRRERPRTTNRRGATAPMGSSTISDNSIVITDTGRP